MPTLTVEGMTVVRGGRDVVKDVSFSLQEGEILGLIGPNGAGKSSTIGGLLGLYPLTRGEISFEGHRRAPNESFPPEILRRFAYIPKQPMYYNDLTLEEHFEWKWRLWGESTAAGQTRLAPLVDQFQLAPHLDKYPHQCSKGTLQKLMIVSAFLFAFDVLIIDEPFIGLDVLSIRQLRELIYAARGNGAAILTSTHVLDAAERMCQRFLFMLGGEIRANGSLTELRNLQQQPDASLEDLFVGIYQTFSGRVE